jgi:hypothetical protein
MIERVLLAGGLVAGMLLAQPVLAQMLYKSTLANGRVVYGDRPDPAAVKVEQITPDTSLRGIGGATPGESAAQREMAGARAGRESAEQRVRMAEKALQEAQAAKAAGEQPLPGERTGTAGGASRLNESYYVRQRQLDQAVEKASSELDQARSEK